MDIVFVVTDEFGYYAGLFIQAKKYVRSQKTLLWYENALKQFKQICKDDWPLEASHCRMFLDRLKGRGVSESTLNNYYRAIRGWLNWLNRNGFIENNPIMLVDAPAAPKPLPRAPTEQDIKRLLDYMAKFSSERWQNCRDLAVFSVALDTGARIGELAGMMIGDIDLLRRKITVYSTKTGKERTLMLGSAVIKDLTDWVSERDRLDLPVGLKNLWVSEYRDQGYRPFTSWGMRWKLGKWQKLAGVKSFRFHAFRHAYAIFSLRNGADILDVRDQLGHANVTTTSIYTMVIGEGRSERHQKTSPRSNL